MQDIDNEFDLLIKESLENAAIKPSRRVWRNVSSHISNKTIIKPVLVWPKWVGGAVAFASLVICAILFIPKSQPELNLLSDNKIELVSLNTFDGKAYQLAALKNRPQKLDEISRTIVDSFIEEETPSINEQAIEKELIEDKTTNSPTKSNESVITLTGSGENASRFFNQLAYEDSKQDKAKLSNYYIRGSVGSNDGLSSYSSSRGYLAPGNSSETEIKEIEASNYNIPISLGIGARFYLIPRLSLGTGINVNILNRSFTGKYNTESGQVTHSMIYLGVPVNIYFDILNFDKIKLYTYAGGEVEYCISNKYTFHGNPDVIKTNPVKHLQLSVSAGIGVEYLITKNFGAYIDPGLQYYFPCNQPKNVRSVRPLIFNFDAGLRFHF